MSYSVNEVVDIGDYSESILAKGLDAPTTAETGSRFDLGIAGWIVGARSPVASLDVMHCGTVVKSAEVRRRRAGVAAKFPGVTGSGECEFFTRLGLLGLPPSVSVDLIAVHADGSRSPLWRVNATHEPLRPNENVVRHPLLLTSLGRTGTTWVMRVLGEHPEIVSPRRYPYETSVGRYWMHAAMVLSRPGDHLRSSDVDHFADNPFMIGHNPFYGDEADVLADWLGETYPLKVASFIRSAIDGYYNKLAKKEGREGAKFFAEKHLPNHLPRVARELYAETVEVVLVRDLRDVIASMLAFNAKRGYASFGREDVSSDVDFVRQVTADFVRLADIVRDRERSIHLIKYEDVIERPQPTWRALFAYLGIEDDASLVDRVLEEAARDDDLADHRTSASPRQSIGRWRSELSSEMVDICEAEGGSVLEAFGYPLRVSDEGPVA